MIIKAPGCKAGIKNNRIVGSVDIYPTLMDLCDISIPEGLDGDSFVNLLRQPDEPSWKDCAYSYYNDGISVRVPDYRCTYYQKGNESWKELYQYTKDGFERQNIADKKPEVVERLYAKYIGDHLLEDCIK